jgi:hypothetical protein
MIGVRPSLSNLQKQELSRPRILPIVLRSKMSNKFASSTLL